EEVTKKFTTKNFNPKKSITRAVITEKPQTDTETVTEKSTTQTTVTIIDKTPIASEYKEILKPVDVFIFMLEERDMSLAAQIYPKVLLEMMFLTEAEFISQYLSNVVFDKFPQNKNIENIDYELINATQFTETELDDINSVITDVGLTQEDLDSNGYNFDINRLYTVDGYHLKLNVTLTGVFGSEKQILTKEVVCDVVKMDGIWTYNWDSHTDFMTGLSSAFSSDLVVF
ncbi:MAG: hypothetical protein LBM93_14485, partial [Oscillospiraceae bacterium]|nr:hypothetical protein [Oscillospiraceae bacterium]